MITDWVGWAFACSFVRGNLMWKDWNNSGNCTNTSSSCRIVSNKVQAYEVLRQRNPIARRRNSQPTHSCGFSSFQRAPLFPSDYVKSKPLAWSTCIKTKYRNWKINKCPTTWALFSCGSRAALLSDQVVFVIYWQGEVQAFALENCCESFSVWNKKIQPRNFPIKFSSSEIKIPLSSYDKNNFN